MTPDLSEFETLSAGRDQRARCKTGQLLDQLDAGERDQLVAALTAKDRVTVGGIVKWAEKRGHDLSVPAVTTHRNGRCRCHG